MPNVLFLLFFVWLSCLTGIEKHKIEGLYRDEPISKTMFWLTRYLPYNPNIGILCSNDNPHASPILCWPEGTFISLDPLNPNLNFECDLIWVYADGAELPFLERASPLLKKAKVVYTSTHFFHKGAYVEKLKQFLESQGFTLVIHWYIENKEGTAIFVKNEIIDGERNSLNCHPTETHINKNISPPLYIDPFLRPIHNKQDHHTMDEIDFIYMINLDERPEKFARATTELHFYGIYPYRFSAVNGWKIPISTINEMGIQFSSNYISKPMMGSCYVQAHNTIYRSNEFIQPNGKTYYPLGMGHGAIGIILSHLSILKDAYDSGYETIWVMEDDVEALSDPREISTLIKKLDRLTTSWDILFTDTDTKDEKGNHVPCRALAARPNLNEKPLSYFLQQFYLVNEDFSHIGMRYGAYSMIIRRSGIEKILKFYQQHRVFLPYDIDFWISGEMNMYCTNKDLVSHRANSLSDNSFPNFENKTDE